MGINQQEINDNNEISQNKECLKNQNVKKIINENIDKLKLLINDVIS